MAKGGGARKYVRDNRGRFAAVGATARGGRLKTAGGSRRATQTRKIQGRPGNTISKPRGLQPGAVKPKPARRTPATSSLRPGELMNANARPVNTMAKPKRIKSPFVAGTGDLQRSITSGSDDKKARLTNVGIAKKAFEAMGIGVDLKSSAKSSVVASYNARTDRVEINRSHPSWKNPAKSMREDRRKGIFSSNSPMHVINHEIGHRRDQRRLQNFETQARIALSRSGVTDYNAVAAKGYELRQVARRVSRYAATNPAELVAEVYAGFRGGRRYDLQVMQSYREAQGLSPRPAARRRSRLPKRGKS